MRSQNFRRLVITVFFVMVAELLLLLWIPPGVLALGSGFVGSVVLIIPPLRIEYLKSGRGQLREIPSASADLQSLRQELESYFTEKIDAWDKWDSFLLCLGGVLLAFYFLFQGVAKSDLVTKHEMSARISELRSTAIEPLKHQLEKMQSDLNSRRNDP